MQIVIKQPDAGERLDKYLLQYLPSFSRGYIQKHIKNGAVKVNNKIISPHYQVKADDVVTIDIKAPAVPDLSARDDIKFAIIDDQPDYVVIDKPAGLLVHPTEMKDELTLINGLLARWPQIAAIGENRLGPGLVHRLDRNVSGLLVVAKTDVMFSHLKKQFKERKVNKDYIALVHGKLTSESGEIRKPIGRSASGDKMAAHPQKQSKDREALTEYKVRQRFTHHTLLDIKIRTGRPHQIRVHLNSIGYPVVGDKLYTNKKIKPANLGRLFLHAGKLGFYNLQNEYQEYTSALPKELKIFLKTISNY